MPIVAPDNQLLAHSWQALSRELGLKHADAMQQQIIRYYAAEDRAYHNVQHLQECLHFFKQVRHLAVHPAEVELALWFHDVIYNPQAADNEQQSAAMAVAFLNQQPVARDVIQRIDTLIMATRTHEASTLDQQLLVDIDLAILAAPAARFDEYQQQIRAEYAFVPEPLFRQKRAEVLAGFLDRERIYQTDYFYRQLEAKARVNLQTALTA